MKYINKNLGVVIDWDETRGTLIESVWEPYHEEVKESKTVEEATVETTSDTTESTELETSSVNERSKQVFDSVKALKAEADSSYEAFTKIGGRYEHNGEKWVKVS